MRTKKSRRKANQLRQKKQFFDRNDYIKAPEMRVITEDGDNLGVLDKSAAMAEARKRELDLILINPGAKPPIAKIISWSKFKYDQSKKEKSQKSKSADVKEMRFKVYIEQGDLEHKVNKVKEFLGKGNKVKVTIQYTSRSSKGRPSRERMQETMNQVLESIGEAGEREGDTRSEGRNIAVYIKPNK